MTTSTNTFRYALHEQKYVILISRIHIWAWPWDGHASHVPVTLQSWTSHVTVTLWTIVMNHDPVTLSCWTTYVSVISRSRGGNELVTRWSWVGHVAVMIWSRGGHDLVTRRSWSGHAPVMIWSRGGHEAVTLRAWFGRLSACRRLHPVQAGRISRIGRCRRRAPLACPPKWPKQRVTVRGDNLQQTYNL